MSVSVWLFAGATTASADGNTSQNGPVAPAPTAKSMAIEVISANYGHSGSFHFCAVTPAVKRSCNGRSRCTVDVNDQLCRPPDVVPTELILTLIVEYKCTPFVRARTVKADRPFQLVIDCSASAR